MAWLLSIIIPIFKPFGAWLIGIFTKDLIAYIQKVISDYMAAKEAKAQAQANLEKYKQAVQNGDLDAQAQAGQDLLNGTKPNP